MHILTNVDKSNSLRPQILSHGTSDGNHWSRTSHIAYKTDNTELQLWTETEKGTYNSNITEYNTDINANISYDDTTPRT